MRVLVLLLALGLSGCASWRTPGYAKAHRYYVHQVAAGKLTYSMPPAAEDSLTLRKTKIK